MPGLVDGFGDRLLMFDNTDSDALEMLRFDAALAGTPAFEEALHERVRALGRLDHPAFPAIRAVERLDTDGSLVLVSSHAPGRRLSTFLAEPRFGKGLHPAFVTWLISQVVQSLSILQSQGDDFAHSSLTADRIILTSDARIRVVEHVLGSALRHLDRSPERLWREFGLIAPIDEGRPRLDAGADVFQVGVLALSMLLARRLTPSDLEERLAWLLEEGGCAATTRSPQFGGPLRHWLERALQLGDRPYHSAAEAYEDLRRLPSSSAPRSLEFLQSGNISEETTALAISPSSPQTSAQEVHVASGIGGDRRHVGGSAPATGTWPVPDGRVPDPSEAFPVEPKTARPASRLLVFADAETMVSPGLPNGAEPPRARSGSRRARLSIAVVAAAAAVVEALVIGAMYLREPPASTVTAETLAAAETPVVRNEPAPATERQPGSAGRPIPIMRSREAVGDGGGVPGSRAPAVGGERNALDAAIAQAARNQRSGGVRLSTPIELKVLQGDRVLGSSADGPIVTAAGTHELDLINTAYGFRARRAVTFRAGEIVTVSVPVPPGRISVNAEPWAEVWIDNQPVGETPLANLEIPVGEHEVVFRHPELGERRQNVVVRADSVTRTSTTFDR